MVLSDGTTSSLRDLYAEHNSDKKVQYDWKNFQPKWGTCQLMFIIYDKWVIEWVMTVEETKQIETIH